MLFLIAKYLSSSSSRRRGGSSSSKNTAAPGDDNRDKTTQRREMPVPAEREREREQGCMAGCVPVAMRGKRSTGASAKVVTVTASSARTSRHGFVRSAASGLFRGAAARGRYFTNHESLPPLPEARAEFAAAFPQYSADAGEEEASAADAIRDAEYPHLARHACLDYTGVNLFSHAQMDSSSSLPSTSSSSSPAWQPPFFDVAYRSATLRSQVEQCDSGNGGIGGAVARRIMASMKMPEEEYVMVCAANRTSAFRLLAESYAFSSSSSGGRNSKKSKKKLLAVYDYESEAVGAMAAAARRRGAEVLHATFAWPSLRLHAADLRKKLLRGRHHQRGLMVFPLVSRMTGARHPYLWMSAAAEQGWHVALDASAMGAKDLDTLGLSLLRPDFVVCNFFKVFGENPSGFAGIFVKKASLAALVDDSPAAAARSIGVVSLVPPRRWSLRDDYSTDLDLSRSFTNPADPDPPPPLQTAEIDITSSFSGPLSSTTAAAATGRRTENSENTAEICEEEDAPTPPPPPPLPEAEEEVAVELRGLDHADSLGLIAIGNRLRCISNWLVIAMQKLKHPHPEDTAIGGGGGGGGQQLVRIYGPRVSFSRGPAVAFNVYDWKGEKVAPGMVQKLADRHAVSLTCGFLRNVSFVDKYDADRSAVLERRGGDGEGEEVWGIHVVNASLGFLSSFEDAYRLWAFVAKFLDADFVEKERWRYTALNQKTVEV